MPPTPSAPRDPHSYAQPGEVVVRHVDLELEVSFERKTLAGAATLDIERFASGAPLRLDTRELTIGRVEAAGSGEPWAPVAFETGPADKILGTPLTISLPGGAARVRIHYSTSPGASALQWLEPRQTSARRPFLFTQSQAIHARSWIPLQDSPGVRVTYSASIRVPKGLRAVMSARMEGGDGGLFRFTMPQAIPSYLIALAAGEIESRELGPRSSVWAEPPVLARAAREFEDTERMIASAERLYGPYRWERYDILVLPPSFPYGGMENPRLTFATPTILAGDKSLTALVAHELAHSWSGNLVTNATWRDFWLNEGFTVYFEQRILEEVYGPGRAAMEAVLAWEELQRDLARLPERDQILNLDLAGRDPEDGVTAIPYLKGALFLKSLELAAGRARFDAFLRSYFDRFAFQSLTTAQFLDYLRRELPEATRRVPVEEWVFKPGLPSSAPRPAPAEAFLKVEAEARKWLEGGAAAAIEAGGWSTHEWLHFFNALPEKLDPGRMGELDSRFRLTQTGNYEVLQQWLQMAVRNGYQEADARLEEFLTTVGRRKYLRPLYEELMKTPGGQRRARAIYAKARPGYHPIAASTLDAIVNP